MNPLVFCFPGYEAFGAALAGGDTADAGKMTLHRFPDGETLVRVHTPVEGRTVVLINGLDHPDEKSMALYLAARAMREQGAQRIVLAAPYLPYMRQDQAFRPGEAVSARYYAQWLSGFLDGLVTIDPHLHRIHRLDEVYTIPSRVVAAAPALAAWVQEHIRSPLLIGPDAESEQWVADVAARAGAPYTVLEKTRHGDRDVEVSLPEVERWNGYTPVLADDIISTARTMIAAVEHLRHSDLAPPVCLGVHAIFAGDALTALQAAGPADIVTCNTVIHPTNRIDVAPLLAEGVTDLLS